MAAVGWQREEHEAMRDSEVSRITEQFRDAADDADRVAAEQQAARAAVCVTDLDTLERVVAALGPRVPYIDTLAHHEYLCLPADTIERRTYSTLRGAR
jgi:hypothetical protein